MTTIQPPSIGLHAAVEKRVVTGTVRNRDGTFVAATTVRAFDKRVARDIPLGSPVRTDSSGRYRIEYGMEAQSCGTGPALIVRAYGAGEAQIAESKIIFNAPAAAEIDLLVGGGIYRGPSEIERLLKAITPCLDDLPLTRLTPAQVRFLARRAGVSPTFVGYAVFAARNAATADVPPEAIYGYVRQGLPADIPRLFAQTPAARRGALERALAANMVPQRLAGELDAIERAIEGAAIKHALQPPQDGSLSVGGVLGAVGLASPLQQKFLGAYAAHSGTPGEFWAAVAKDRELGPEVPKIQLSIQLGAVARGHLPLVQALSGRAKSLGDLAKLTDTDWRDLVQKTGVPAHVPGRTPAEKASIYVSALKRSLEVLIPSALLIERAKTDSLLGTPAVRAFFDKNPRFDFGTDSVQAALGDPGGSDAALAVQLKRIQRVFRITPRFSDIRHLIASGLHSSRAVAQMGRTAFVAAHGETLGGARRAGEIFDRARQIAATAALLFARHSPRVNAAVPAVIRPSR